MKKYAVAILIILVGIIAFIAIMRLTNSWKLSLWILTALVFYAFWIIRFELGFTRSNKENAEQQFNKQKSEHIENTKDNPTIR